MVVRRKTRNLLVEFSVVLAVLVVLLRVTIPRFLDAQTINDEKHFPDTAFRVAVEKFMGVEPEGSFSESEAARKEGLLNCTGNVSDLTGMEYFQSMSQIRCWSSKLTHVDFSKNPHLESIELGYSAIASLDLSQNIELKNLICYKLELTQLDVSHNPNLILLHCMENQLTNIDVSKNPALRELICRDNPIAQLDLSKNSELRYLCCDKTAVTELDLNHNPGLDRLYCQGNQLTWLDLSKNHSLKDLHCKNNQIAELVLCASPVLEFADLSQNRLPSIHPFTGIKTLFFLDVRQNDLDKDDWPDVQEIIEYFKKKPPALTLPRGGNRQLDFFYSPQNGMNPYP